MYATIDTMKPQEIYIIDHANRIYDTECPQNLQVDICGRYACASSQFRENVPAFAVPILGSRKLRSLWPKHQFDSVVCAFHHQGCDMMISVEIVVAWKSTFNVKQQ